MLSAQRLTDTVYSVQGTTDEAINDRRSDGDEAGARDDTGREATTRHRPRHAQQHSLRWQNQEQKAADLQCAQQAGRDHGQPHPPRKIGKATLDTQHHHAEERTFLESSPSHNAQNDPYQRRRSLIFDKIAKEPSHATTTQQRVDSSLGHRSRKQPRHKDENDLRNGQTDTQPIYKLTPGNQLSIKLHRAADYPNQVYGVARPERRDA